MAVPVSDEPAATQIDLAGRPVVVLSRDGGGGAFSSIIDGSALELVADGDGFTDRLSGDTFGLDGQSLETGRQLEPVPSRSSFWFAVVAAFPEVEVVAAGR